MTYNAPADLIEQVFVEKNWFRFNSKWMIKHHLNPLLERLSHIQHTEAQFKRLHQEYEIDVAAMKADCLIMDDTTCRLRLAANYIALTKMSRGGMPECGFSWTPETTRLRGGQQAETNSWEGMIARMPKLSDRLQTVDIINGYAQAYMKLIAAGPNPSDWFIYLDPTYTPSVRTTNAKEYGDDEMTYEDHVLLVNQIMNHPSKIAISHYQHPLYDAMGWRRVDFSMPNHSGQNKVKQRRIEAVYTNYDA